MEASLYIHILYSSKGGGFHTNHDTSEGQKEMRHTHTHKVCMALSTLMHRLHSLQ